MSQTGVEIEVVTLQSTYADGKVVSLQNIICGSQNDANTPGIVYSSTVSAHIPLASEKKQSSLSS